MVTTPDPINSELDLLEKQLADLTQQRQALAKQIERAGGKEKVPALHAQEQELDIQIKHLRKQIAGILPATLNNLGLDFYGLGSHLWDVDMTISVLPQGYGFGYMSKAVGFGDPNPKVKKMCDAGKYPFFRVQIWYDTGHNLCPMNVLAAELPFCEAMAKAHAGMKVYVSHSTEYNGGLSDVQARINYIKQHAPTCIPVNNPWQGAVTSHEIVETHITDSSALEAFIKRTKLPYAGSTDGIPASNVDVTTYKELMKNSAYCFLWASRFNLHCQGTDSHPMPPIPNRVSVPNADYIKGYVRMLSDEGVAPPPNFHGKIVPIKDPLLYKTYGQNDYCGQNDPRANKPLAYIHTTGDGFHAVTKDGKQVAFFKAYTSERSYAGWGSGEYGWQIGEKAKALSGSEFIWLQDKAVYYGPVNPSFRKGTFRIGAD